MSGKFHALQLWNESEYYMPRGYITSQTCVRFMNYHFVWCPKYRRPILVNKIKERLRELIRESRTIGMQSYRSQRRERPRSFIRPSKSKVVAKLDNRAGEGIHLKGFEERVSRTEEQIAYPVDKELFRLHAWAYL